MNGSPTHQSTLASNEPRYRIKAVASESRASSLVGGFSDEDRRLYHAGLQHIYNIRDKVGAYTVGQVIDLERAREQERSEEAQRQADQRKAAEEANYIHGSPDCLVLDKRTLTTESAEYTWYIEGKVTNRCDRDFRYAQVEFTFFDGSGNQTASGLVNINNLDAGQTWSFKKSVYETQVSGTWRVAGLSAF